MRFRRYALTTIIASGLMISPARSSSSCGPEHSILRFNDVGLISAWELCYKGKRHGFVDETRPILDLRLSGSNAATIPSSDWRHESGRTYVLENAQTGIEITRAYEELSESSLIHSIVIRNRSSRALPAMRIELEIGGPPGSDRYPDGSLAGYMYDFQRTAADNGEWISAGRGDSASRFALVARHKTLVIEASEPWSLQPAGAHGSDQSEDNQAPHDPSGPHSRPCTSLSRIFSPDCPGLRPAWGSRLSCLPHSSG